MEFDDYRDADDACHELNGRDLDGDRVTVEIARGTPHGRDREKWGSGSGGHGGGRDRRDGGMYDLFSLTHYNTEKTLVYLVKMEYFFKKTSILKALFSKIVALFS